MNIMIVNQDVPSVLNIKIMNMMNKASSLIIRKTSPSSPFLKTYCKTEKYNIQNAVVSNSLRLSLCCYFFLSLACIDENLFPSKMRESKQNKLSRLDFLVHVFLSFFKSQK